VTVKLSGSRQEKRLEEAEVSALSDGKRATIWSFSVQRSKHYLPTSAA